MTAAYLYDAVRTPFGRFNGALAGVRPDDLASYVITALLERNPQLQGAAVDEVIREWRRRAQPEYRPDGQPCCRA
jgi:acetyl-CoA acetyltransferase